MRVVLFFIFGIIFSVSSFAEEVRPSLLLFLGNDPYSKVVREYLAASLEFQEMCSGLVEFKEISTLEEDNLAYLKQLDIERSPTLLLLDPVYAEVLRLEGREIEMAHLFIEKRLSDLKRVVHFLDSLAQQQDPLAIKDVFLVARSFKNRKILEPIIEAGVRLDPTPFFLVEKYRIAQEDREYLRRQIMRRNSKKDLKIDFEIALIDFEYNKSKGVKSEKAALPLINFIKQVGSKDMDLKFLAEEKLMVYFFSQSKMKEALVHGAETLKLAPLHSREAVEERYRYIKQYAL